MKKVVINILLLFIYSHLFSQNEDNKWAFGFDYSTLNYKRNLEKSDDWTNGVDISFIRYLNSSFEGVIHGSHNFINKATDASNQLIGYQAYLYTGGLDFRYKFNNGYFLGKEGLLQPYLAIGAGIYRANILGYNTDNSDKEIYSPNYYWGGGAKIKISDRIKISLEYGQINFTKDEFVKTITTTNSRSNFWNAQAGLVIELGINKDEDNDLVLNRFDLCPKTPPTVVVDKNGCPVDSDKDGLADYMDRCPDVKGLISLFGCPDSDNDGVADQDDECPDTEEGQKVNEKGCPIDNDGDGVLNTEDNCPEIPGEAALQGCPDSDQDGVADPDDKCPDTPANWEVDKNGCPLDNDKDGIINEEDACPDVPGTKNNNGCPEKKPEKNEYTKVPIIWEIQPVYFVPDKSYITDYSKNKLNKLIAILKEYPTYQLNITGHTDSQASDEYNIKLSQKRIDSVIKYLKKNGISVNRIESQIAMGESHPVKPNDTPEGRKWNRRVEFSLFLKK